MAKCVILIEDETNCQITGLDLRLRKILSNKFKYEIPGARFTPAVRLGRWDGKKSFCSIGTKTYINLLPEILPILDANGYDIELEDIRNYNTQFTFQEVSATSYDHKKWPEGHTLAGEPIVLRDYQVEVINNFLANTQSIHSVSTGAGKTLITAILSHKMEPYGRSIIIVPNKDLVRQTEADYINLGLDVGVFYGDRKEYNRTHTICTWQSLNSLFKNTKNALTHITFSEFIEDVVGVICDEVHQAKADVLMSMLTSVMAKIPIRWGVTGTIPKEEYEKRSLQVSIGEVVGIIKAHELQEKGVLSNCHINIKQLVDYGVYKQYQDEQRYLLTNTARIQHIASMIHEISKSGNTLVLIDRVEPGKMISDLITDSVFLSGSTKSTERKEQYDSYQINDGKVTIATYGIAAIGINIVNIHNLIIIEPGKSFVRTIQSIGRGLRKGKEKDFVNVYDISSTCKFSKRHLTQRKKYYTEANYEYSIEKLDWQK